MILPSFLFSQKVRLRFLITVTLLLFKHVQGQQLDFFRYLSIGEFQANDVKKTEDGGYLIAGGYHGPSGGDFILLKTDSEGIEEWDYTNDRFDGLNASNRIFSFVILNGYYYLVGDITDVNGSSNYPLRVYVVKMDSLLNKIWEREDTLWGGKGFANKIKISSDNKFV